MTFSKGQPVLVATLASSKASLGASLCFARSQTPPPSWTPRVWFQADFQESYRCDSIASTPVLPMPILWGRLSSLSWIVFHSLVFLRSSSSPFRWVRTVMQARFTSSFWTSLMTLCFPRCAIWRIVCFFVFFAGSGTSSNENGTGCSAKMSFKEETQSSFWMRWMCSIVLHTVRKGSHLASAVILSPVRMPLTSFIDVGSLPPR